MMAQIVSQSKEVRFAVVMYGGVSLAIYINGVAQELYNLVRATATKELNNNTKTYLFPDEDLKGASKVYRRLGEKLNTRFVVDILSGTSAGGINAIFLAKSLANGETFETLKDLWISEGDIGVLINDHASEDGLDGLKVNVEPTSLLNSQRMLFKLLWALDIMKPDRSSTSNEFAAYSHSPFVDELDLFVTATDIRGLIQPINLAVGTTYEHCYKNVFRFRYATADAAGGEDTNSFNPANNPFLAFAARCTSSFPFAFEPMRLDDVNAVVNTRTFKKKYSYDPNLWKGFYKKYAYSDGDFATRSFGDGGYLDNKPFTYATECLLRRKTEFPVDRKLIYIEPSPEHLIAKDEDIRPDAIQNVVAALLTLPRYETIREDLQQVMDRNKMIHQVGSIMKQVQHVSRAALSKDVGKWQMKGSKWANLYLDNNVIKWYGPGYAAYHQLRVASVLDDLGSGLARAMGWEENSNRAHIFRQRTLEGWRNTYYRTDPHADDKRKSENELLFRLDTRWRIRRLQFMQSLINDLLAGLSGDASDVVQTRVRNIIQDSQGDPAEWPFEDDIETQSTYHQALLWIKSRFNDAYVDLRAKGRKIRARNLASSPKWDSADVNFQAYKKHLIALKDVLESKAEDKKVFSSLESLTQSISSSAVKPKVKGVVRTMHGTNSYMCKVALGMKPAPAKVKFTTKPEHILKTLQTCLSYYYNRYEYYDMLTFPLFYGSNVGESDVVEVVRISPDDAPSLKPGSEKLVGTKLGNFGAFFVREWRENDMLWGRLDGAECLINSLLPGEENANARDTLIDEAHQAILKETFLGVDQEELFKALQSTNMNKTDEVKKALTRALGDENQVKEHFINNYKVSAAFPPETTLDISSRASLVTGKLLSSLSSKYPALASPAGTLARLGQIFTGLVQVALPKSLPHLLFSYWIWLLYLLELLLALGGKPLGLPDVAQLGGMALGITVAAHLAVLILQAALKNHLPSLKFLHRIITSMLILGAMTVVILSYLGFVHLGIFQAPTGIVGSWIGALQGQ